MFPTNSYEITRALVAERQAVLRHEARQHRRTRRARRTEASITRLPLSADRSPVHGRTSDLAA